MTVPTAKEMEVLEAMIDAHGVEQTLIAIGVICGDKADHIRANWQDAKLARRWDQCGSRIESVSQSSVILAISPSEPNPLDDFNYVGSKHHY